MIATLTTSTSHTARCNLFTVFTIPEQYVGGGLLSVIKSQGGDVPAAGETTQAFALSFPYLKHLTKLSPCAQSKVLWLIVQTALSACVSHEQSQAGLLGCTCSLINEPLLWLGIAQKRLIFYL